MCVSVSVCEHMVFGCVDVSAYLFDVVKPSSSEQVGNWPTLSVEVQRVWTVHLAPRKWRRR